MVTGLCIIISPTVSVTSEIHNFEEDCRFLQTLYVSFDSVLSFFYSHSAPFISSICFLWSESGVLSPLSGGKYMPGAALFPIIAVTLPYPLSQLSKIADPGF